MDYWQRSKVTGVTKEEGQWSRVHGEDVLHRRGEDPIVLACRRNPGIAAAMRIKVETAEAFQAENSICFSHVGRKEIPRDNRERFVEWDW